MKVIIAGSRHLAGEGVYRRLCDAAHAFTDMIGPVSEVVSGGARGVDRLGERLAEECLVPVKRFPAEWAAEGKAAGPIRNRKMAEYADALLLLWDGKSPGSRSMLAEMKRLGKPTYEAIVPGEDGP